MHNQSDGFFSHFGYGFFVRVYVSLPAMIVLLFSALAFVVFSIAITIALLGEERRVVGLASVTMRC